MKALLTKYVEGDKIKVIPNWSSSSDLKPIKKTLNPFVIEHNLVDKFIVMYSGNIGYTHNVELILDLAIRLKQDKSIHFLIIGNGGKKRDLLCMAKKEGLDNCTFLDYQPADRIKYSLAAADISVVTLTDETASVSVPSKTYNLLAVGSPILCIANKSSEIARLVMDEMCGAVFENNEIDAMLSFLQSLKENKEMHKVMVNNSLKASLKYTYLNAGKYVI